MDKTRGKLKIRLLIMGGALLCFAFIAYYLYAVQSGGIEGYNSFDENIRQWVYSIRSSVLNIFFTGVTYLGNWQTITLLCIVLLAVKKTGNKIGVPLAITAVSSTVIYKLVKMFFARPRPELAVRLIKQGGYSFPSGHSMNCIVVYGLLIYLIRKYCHNKRTANVLTALLTVLIALIGISRVYVGVHFPTDVLGGWSLGLAVLMIAITIIEKEIWK